MKKKKITLLAVVLTTAAMLTGCTIENEYVPVDTEVQVMETNDMGIPSLSQTLDIPDEDFKLVCEYGTNGYDLNNWRVTDPKQISMKVHTQGLPDGYDVVIDHVHADISLLSTSPQINGINQTSSGNLKNQAVLDITDLKAMIHAAEEIHMILRQNVLYRLRNAENVNFLSNNKK